MKRNILVVGGAGYVGAVLVPKLLARGHRVRVLDWFLYLCPQNFPQFNSSNLELVVGDLRDSTLVQKCLSDIDCVIHLAGISNDPSSELSPDLTIDVNITGTKNLIALASRMGVERFICASSSSVYGIKEEPNVTESLSLEPLTIYSRSKVEIENCLHQKDWGMKTVSVRSATVCGYSPRMRLDLTVNILTHHAIRWKRITVHGGNQKRPNIHIDDISRFYINLVESDPKPWHNKAFNVCGENHTVAQIAHLVKKTVAPHAEIIVEPTNDHRSYHISAMRAKDELGFVPKMRIEDAIQDVATAIETHQLSDLDDNRHYNVRLMKAWLARNEKAPGTNFAPEAQF